jgi:hypothetical protein
MRIHVNGRLAGQMERTDGRLGSVDSHPLEFGHYVASRSQRFAGELDEVRLYRRALTADEIADSASKERARIGVE